MRSESGSRITVVEEERRRTAAAEVEGIEEEFEVEDVGDEGRLGKRRRSMFTLLAWDIGLDSTHRVFNIDKVIDGIKGFSQGFFIHPQNRWYRAWEKFILLWAVYSSFFTPMEFGFFRGLPDHLFLLDIVGQTAIFIDIVLQFFVA